ncbi:hypothetical protein ES703_103646 [subsurface metagenome]
MVTIPRNMMSLLVLVRILPHSNSRAPDLVPGISPINRKAIPSIKEKMTPNDVSGLSSPRSARGPIIAAEKRLKAKAPIKGLKPNHSPSRAPAKAACDIHTPINGMCISTTKTPMVAQVIPPRKAERIAFCMNW